MTKVCHISTAHPPFDVRIFHKECVSLAKAGFDVSLLVTHDKEERVEGVNIIPLPVSKGRISRMVFKTKKAYSIAKKIDADIYHLHDPELLPVARKLKKRGKKVIFDAHEDFPKQLLSKPYLNKTILKMLSKFFSYYEKRICSKLDFIVTATPVIRDKFLRFNNASVDINNYPILGELSTGTKWEDKKNEICYIGGISKIRGIIELVNSLENTPNVILNLAGSFGEKQLENEVKEYSGWKRVNYAGLVGRKEVAAILGKSKIGLVTFHPLPNHIDAQPNKMFEYMSAGIPIITSNFDMWREVVEGNNCGVCVDPESPEDISEAINSLINNEEASKQMGLNGMKAITEKYNWQVESQKLIEMYNKLIKS